MQNWDHLGSCNFEAILDYYGNKMGEHFDLSRTTISYETTEFFADLGCSGFDWFYGRVLFLVCVFEENARLLQWLVFFRQFNAIGPLFCSFV